MFPDEEACARFVAKARWPEGFRCPRCDGKRSYVRSKRRETECAKCGYVGSVTAGTVMHGTRKPLGTWLLAAWLLVTDKRGISSYQLERQLGLRHETAFQMLHKLRAAMVAPDREMLRGTVELDETALGSAKRGRDVKDIYAKTWVVGAVEVREGRNRKGEPTTYPGRIRLRHVPGRTYNDLLLFVIESVKEGATIVTDDLSHYRDIPLAGYERRVESTAHGTQQRDVLTHYHLVASNLKAWLAGTHHGRVEPKHLQAYLNEFVFRYNRRRNLPAAFARLLGIGTHLRGPTYDQLHVDAGEPGGWQHPDAAREEAEDLPW